MLSRTMNVPVRPTPALQCTSMGGLDLLNFDLTRRMNLMRAVANCGKHSVPTKKVVARDGEGGGLGVCRLWGASQGRDGGPGGQGEK